jgi:hypothetical protein
VKLRFVRLHEGSDHPLYDLWIEDGELRSDKPEVLKQYDRPERLHGREVTPADGDLFLQAVHVRCGRGSYTRCIVEDNGSGS